MLQSPQGTAKVGDTAKARGAFLAYHEVKRLSKSSAVEEICRDININGNTD